jgi:phage recombination protein Bet
MTTRELLADLKNSYSQLVIYDDKNAMLPVDTYTEFHINAERPVKEWKFWNKKDKAEIATLALTELMKTLRQDIAEVWHDIKEREGTTKEEPVNDPLDNLKDAGFEIPEEVPIVDQPKEEPKKEKWSRPTPKPQPKKQETLPIPIDVRGKQIAELTMDDVKKYVCPLATDQEIYMFLKLCQARGLNPFLNEVYLIKYGNEAAQTVVAKETFTRKAEQNQYVDGFEAGIMVRNENGEIEYRPGTFWMKGEAILGGWAKVYRTDKKYPYEAQVPYQEFEGKKKDGTVTKFWRTMPATMIRKVALVQALREALPSELSGLYDVAEISSGAVIEADYEVA